MRKRNYKGRVQKRVLPKSREKVRIYDEIQHTFSYMLNLSQSVRMLFHLKCRKMIKRPLPGLVFTLQCSLLVV